MIPRPDLLDERSPRGLEVFQLTHEPGVPCSHVYMEAQIFTPDSRRLVLRRMAGAHGGDAQDPRHALLLCDLEDGGRLTPLTQERGVRAPALSPDGRWLYYLLNEASLNAGRVLLKRVGLDGTGRETMIVIDQPLPGAKAKIGGVHGLSTIRSDGRRLCGNVFLGDGTASPPPFGLVVFDLDEATVELIMQGPEITTTHPQYCRSGDAELSRDILFQENHGNLTSPEGKKLRHVDDGPGVDIHVGRDDGTNLRDMPWGRNGREWCNGHQVWRGRSGVALGIVGMPVEGNWSPDAVGGWQERIIEAAPAAHHGHIGADTPGARRIDVTESFPGLNKRFFHLATDIEGRRFIADVDAPPERGCLLYVAELGGPLAEPARTWAYLLDTRTHFWKGEHPHAFLSPDGTMGFFNSDESGLTQAYMVRGF